ncbi:MAG: MFS transporter, partial [Clostridia bacterium]|nr:MFS transporter [Clostridia bacterium]
MGEYKTTWREKLGYGVGAVGLDLSYGLFYSYLAYYLSSVLGLTEGFLLIITPLARIWDGINDPIMGSIVDSTKTKIGKYRPWILIGAISNAVVLSLLFTRFGMSGTKLYIYIAVMYVLWGMTNTMVDIPYWSMVPSFTNDPKDRNLIATVARTFSGIGQGLISVLTPEILPLLSKGMTTEDGYSADGFSKWATICGGFLVIFALISFFSTKERNVIYNNDKFSFKKVLKVIKSNDQLVVFMIFAMISNAGWYLTSGTAVYFFTDVLGAPKAQSLFSIIGAVGSALGLLVIPILSKKFSNRTIYQISLGLAITGYVLMFITGPVLWDNIHAALVSAKPDATADSLNKLATLPLGISYTL